MILTEAQRELYVPPPCDRCGGPICCDERGSKRVELERCRICRRPVGRIHAGECAEIVLSRLDDPVYVRSVDCYPPSPESDWFTGGQGDQLPLRDGMPRKSGDT